MVAWNWGGIGRLERAQGGKSAWLQFGASLSLGRFGASRGSRNQSRDDPWNSSYMIGKPSSTFINVRWMYNMSIQQYMRIFMNDM